MVVILVVAAIHVLLYLALATSTLLPSRNRKREHSAIAIHAVPALAVTRSAIPRLTEALPALLPSRPRARQSASAAAISPPVPLQSEKSPSNGIAETRVPPPIVEPAIRSAESLPSSAMEAPLDLTLRPNALNAIRSSNPAMRTEQSHRHGFADAVTQALKAGGNRIEDLGNGRVRVRQGTSCYEVERTQLSRVDPYSQAPPLQARRCSS